VRAADGPRAGLAVLALSAELRGAWCGRLLAEQGAAPCLGEHTRGILGELGYTPEDIAALAREGALT
jgi:crotonobetainyl-CoA:carnitine CoA-transferase CaiB-like acyl-CoA transferase